MSAPKRAAVSGHPCNSMGDPYLLPQSKYLTNYEYGVLAAARIEGKISAEQFIRYQIETPWRKRVRLAKLRFWRLIRQVRSGQLSHPWFCSHCKCPRWLSFIQPMTLYETEPSKPDQNWVGFLCQRCAKKYREYWQNQWDEYNAGRM
jgi:hypothetical protein